MIETMLEVTGLQSLEPRFRTEKLDISDIQSLRDSKLSRLGVTTIVDRGRKLPSLFGLLKLKLRLMQNRINK